MFSTKMAQMKDLTIVHGTLANTQWGRRRLRTLHFNATQQLPAINTSDGEIDDDTDFVI